MSDLVLLPSPPGGRPPADGFARALRGARRRRLRTLGTGAGVVAGVLAAAVVAFAGLPAGSAAGHGLEPVTGDSTWSPPPDPTLSPVAASQAPSLSATPTATAEPPVPTVPGQVPTPTAYPLPGGPVTADDGGGATAEPPGGPTAGPTTDPYPTTEPPATPTSDPSASPSPTSDPAQREPVTFTRESQSLTAPCQGSTWCLSTEVRGGDTDASRTLRFYACRGTSNTDGVLHLTRDLEVDFRVTAVGGGLVWRWMRLKPVSDPHDLTVDQLQCAVWSTVWHRVDGTGQPVPAGQYRGEAEIYWSNATMRWYSTTFVVA